MSEMIENKEQHSLEKDHKGLELKVEYSREHFSPNSEFKISPTPNFLKANLIKGESSIEPLDPGEKITPAVSLHNGAAGRRANS